MYSAAIAKKQSTERVQSKECERVIDRTHLDSHVRLLADEAVQLGDGPRGQAGHVLAKVVRGVVGVVQGVVRGVVGV